MNFQNQEKIMTNNNVIHMCNVKEESKAVLRLLQELCTDNNRTDAAKMAVLCCACLEYLVDLSIDLESPELKDEINVQINRTLKTINGRK